MNSILPINMANADLALPRITMSAAPQLAEFAAEMETALHTLDQSSLPRNPEFEVKVQQTPQSEEDNDVSHEPLKQEAAWIEKPIDSSISVAVAAPDLQLPDTQPVPNGASDVPPLPFEPPEMPLDGSALSVNLSMPDVRAALAFARPPIMTQKHCLDISPVSSSPPALPINFAPLQIARSDEIKITTSPPAKEPVFEPAQLETDTAPVLAFSTPATRLDAHIPSLDMQDREWTAQLTQEILSARDEATPELTFRLTPKHLGTLDIGLTETPLGLIIELRPSSEEAKAIVAREEPRLIDELRQRGVPVADPSLQSGANSDGRHNRNGAIPRPFLPFPDSDRKTVKDQDQHSRPRGGRFA